MSYLLEFGHQNQKENPIRARFRFGVWFRFWRICESTHRFLGILIFRFGFGVYVK